MPVLMDQLPTLLQALDQRAVPDSPLNYTLPRTVPKSLPKPKHGERDGLLVYNPAALELEGNWPIQSEGECPGGYYWYVTDTEEAVRLLEHWAANAQWAAIDLETSAGWRKRINPQPGENPWTWINTAGTKPKPFGSDPWTSLIRLCSVSVNPGEAIVFDFRALAQDAAFRTAFHHFITTTNLVAARRIFEAGFFAVQCGGPARLPLDPQVMHQVLTAGILGGNDLGSMTSKYFGLKLEKSWQGNFLHIHPESLIPDGAIRYAAADVVQLLVLAQKIYGDLGQEELLSVWHEIEQPLMEEMSRSYIGGICLDQKKFATWKAETEPVHQARLARWEALAPGINPASPTQLLKWFQEQGVLLKAKGAGEDELLDLLRDWCRRHKIEVPKKEDQLLTLELPETPATLPLRAAQALILLRETTRILGVYVLPFLPGGAAHNPVTERTHPQGHQNEARTGRMSYTEPPIQTIPSKGEWKKVRNGFVADPGMQFLLADYSQIELRILAELADEQKMLAIFQDAYEINQELKAFCVQHELTHWGVPYALADMAKDEPERYAKIATQHPSVVPLVLRAMECDFHRRMAAELFEIPLSDVDSDQRTCAKTVSFGIIFDRGGEAIAREVGRPAKEGKELLERFFRRFPGIQDFQNSSKDDSLYDGATATLSGRKRFYHPKSERDYYDDFRALCDSEHRQDQKKWAEVVKKHGLNRWKPEQPANTNLVYLARSAFRSANSGIGRQGKNHPIQGASGDITKGAVILAGPALRAIDPLARIPLIVHDEVDAVIRDAYVEPGIRALEQAMLDAAYRYLQKVPVEIGLKISPYWTK